MIEDDTIDTKNTEADGQNMYVPSQKSSRTMKAKKERNNRDAERRRAEE